MSDPQGYYEILGVPPTASDEEIKTAYKKLIRKYHPDAGTEIQKIKSIPDEIEREKKKEEIIEICKKINEAKTVLTDPEQKALYDRPQDQEFFDIFDFFGGRKPRNKGTEVRIQISFEESYTGKKVDIKLKKKKGCKPCNSTGGTDIKKCNTCKGTGRIKKETINSIFVTINEVKCTNCINGEIIKNKCKECNGQKFSYEEYTKEVFIPQGTENGDKYVINEEGEKVILVVLVEENEKFFKIKNHLIMKEKIDLYESISGGNILINFINNKKIKIKLNKVTDLEKCIRVRGLGFKGKGDLFIQPVYEFKSQVKDDLVILNKINKEEECDNVYKSDYADLPVVEQNVNGGGFFSNFFGM